MVERRRRCLGGHADGVLELVDAGPCAVDRAALFAGDHDLVERFDRVVDFAELLQANEAAA